MNEIKNVELKSQVKKIKLIGMISIFGFSAIWFIMLFIQIMTNTSLQSRDFINYIYLTIMCALGIFTCFHLWSRVPAFEGNQKMQNLFKSMGLTFLPLILIFTIQLIDYALKWNGFPTIFGTLNAKIPTLEFYFFNIEKFRTTMPADSILIFDIVIFALIFYINPMEQYVGKKRWRIYILLICFFLVLLTPFVVNFTNIWIISIMTIFIVLFVLYSFGYLFYLYFNVAIRGIGNMRKGGLLIAFGILFMILTWVAGWLLPLLFDLSDILKIAIQYAIGILAVVMFNSGFYILRPLI